MSPRQAEYLAVVRAHYEKYGTPPPARWVCKLMGTASVSGAMNALQSLARLGYLAAVKTPGGYTRYVPVDRPGGGARLDVSPQLARTVASLRRVADELRKRAAELERLAGELERRSDPGLEAQGPGGNEPGE